MINKEVNNTGIFIIYIFLNIPEDESRHICMYQTPTDISLIHRNKLNSSNQENYSPIQISICSFPWVNLVIHRKSRLISFATLRASADVPVSPFIDNPMQYNPFFPFQLFGNLCLHSPSSSNMKSSPCMHSKTGNQKRWMKTIHIHVCHYSILMQWRESKMELNPSRKLNGNTAKGHSLTVQN